MITFVVLKSCTHLCDNLNATATILVVPGHQIIVAYAEPVFVAQQQK